MHFASFDLGDPVFDCAGLRVSAQLVTTENLYGVDPEPANADAVRDWTVDYFDATHPYSAGGAYVNFMMDEGQERVKATYRSNYDRLSSVKSQYDPENTFRVNQNIQPAA